MKLGLIDFMKTHSINYDKFIDWNKMELFETDEIIGRTRSGNDDNIYGLPKVLELFEIHSVNGSNLVIYFTPPKSKLYLVYEYIESLKFDLDYYYQFIHYKLINPIYKLNDDNIQVTFELSN